MGEFAFWLLKLQHFFQTRARFLFVKILKPVSHQEDARRQEFILNILLLCSLFLSLTCSILILIDVHRAGTDYDGVPAWLVMSIFAVFSGLLMFSRLGFFRISAYILLLLYVLPLIYMTITWGIDLPQGLLIYALLIVMSSVLIGTRFSLIFTLLLVIYLGTLAFAYGQGSWQPEYSWRSTPFTPFDGIVYAVTFVALSAVSWLSNREIEKSLIRARHSEAALKQERDSLEVKVVERTEELRKVQAAQMVQLHRFVEFGRLASGLFHDLANPLTAVALNLESLKDQSSTVGNAKLHVEHALRATKGLENFIAAARKQLQTQENNSTFDIVREIEEVVSVLSHKAKKAGVDIDYQLPSGQLMVGNVLKFHQVIANLLSNAIDAYAKLARNVERPPIVIAAVSSVQEITITVTDSGCGIPTEIQTRIFEPFFTTKGIESGMGIGLSSTKNIVDNDFHGTITFTSFPKRGTSFIIHLPLTVASTTSGAGSR